MYKLLKEKSNILPRICLDNNTLVFYISLYIITNAKTSIPKFNIGSFATT